MILGIPPQVLLFAGLIDELISIKVGERLGVCRLFCHRRGYVSTSEGKIKPPKESG